MNHCLTLLKAQMVHILKSGVVVFICVRRWTLETQEHVLFFQKDRWKKNSFRDCTELKKQVEQLLVRKWRLGLKSYCDKPFSYSLMLFIVLFVYQNLMKQVVSLDSSSFNLCYNYFILFVWCCLFYLTPSTSLTGLELSFEEIPTCRPASIKQVNKSLQNKHYAQYFNSKRSRNNGCQSSG